MNRTNEAPPPPAGHSFEELAQRYNFRNTAPRRRMFTELVIDELQGRPKPVRAVDIGCGRGIGTDMRWTRMIREHVDDFWGIEPDSSVTPEDGLFDHFQHALMETAELPENTFDVAYSHMVMEHVEEPAGFLSAVYRCLKPGGRYYFITPNGRHYFSLITRALMAARLDEFVLRVIKGNRAEEYHYPVQYRCNTARDVTRVAAQVGFESPQFVFAEDIGPWPYFPGPLRPIYHAMNLKRRVIRNPRCLLNLVARMTKPAA